MEKSAVRLPKILVLTMGAPAARRWDYTQEEWDKWFMVERGGDQGDYRAPPAASPPPLPPPTLPQPRAPAPSPSRASTNAMPWALLCPSGGQGRCRAAAILLAIPLHPC